MREHGVRHTTTKLVARRAGVSEGSIYNHFANRSALIVEAFALATRSIRQRAQSLDQLVGEHTVEENLVALMEAIIEFFREIMPVVGSILGDPQLRSWFTDAEVSGPDGRPLTPLTGVVEVSRYLEQEQLRGRLPKRNSWPAAAAMLIGACLQYVYLEALSPTGMHSVLPQGAPADYAREVVRTLFDE